MDLGEMDQVIRFEQSGRVSDGAGGYTLAWSTVAETWAKVEPVSSREALRAGQIEASSLYRITFPNDRGLTIRASMRIIWTTNGDMVMNIRQAADPGPRPLVREIVAEEGTA